jgi:putative tricarboxylic transport membrane protein
MIFAALLIQGVQPGPFLVAEHPDVFWGVIASMYIGNVMLLILNLPLVGLWVQVLKVPYSILAPIVVLICAIGVYSIKNDPAEILIMLCFGLLGYVLRKLGFDAGPLLLAFILGPMVEKSMRQSLILSGGAFSIFVTRPISATLLGSLTAVVLLQITIALRRRWAASAERTLA